LYADVSIFTQLNMAAVRHLEFVEGSGGTTQEGPLVVAIPCNNFVTIGVAAVEVISV